MEMNVPKLEVPFGSFYSYANIKIDCLTSLELRLIPVKNSRIKKLNTTMQCNVPLYTAHNEIWVIYLGA